jgi:hypothetical protein
MQIRDVYIITLIFPAPIALVFPNSRRGLLSFLFIFVFFLTFCFFLYFLAPPRNPRLLLFSHILDVA